MEKLKFKRGTSPLAVVDTIRQKAFDPEHFGSTDNYIDWLVNNLWTFFGLSVRVTGKTTGERAASLVGELQLHGLVSFC